MIDKTVLVTGAIGGIGKATALGLAAMGAHVAITGRSSARTQQVAHEIRAASGRQVEVFVADLSSRAELRGKLADQVLQRLCRISGARAYNQSKLANVLFSYELARRLAGSRVTANALHPGVVSTTFGAEDPGLIQRLLVPFMRPFMKTPA